jgi:hypothetical protein
LAVVEVVRLLLVKRPQLSILQVVMAALERLHLLLEHLSLTLVAVEVVVNKAMAQVQKQGVLEVQVAAVQAVLAELILQLRSEHQELQILEAVEVEVRQTDLIRPLTDTKAVTAALAL